ncbi:spore germination protein GerPB [Brevibacillus nitrificans]|uniref:spore germination protein GerPB n=1 Tax=Brevibacillus nitrificans TaxID=651560 RepID=UPI0028566187|nr:spore germination protein GerPB [Brevibacillus nitrificans]MDR7318625.1 spore germination protein PB [Brevibacillus nitrificans]
MNFIVHQNITIHTLKIDGLTNSSVFQIGSAGIIKPLSQLYNSGGFTEQAPAATMEPGEVMEPERPRPDLFVPLIPLVEPR